MITNQGQFPYVEFLPEAQFRQIGTVGGMPLIFLGKELGTDAPIVAIASSSDPKTEDLRAIELYLLMGGQDPVEITEEV